MFKIEKGELDLRGHSVKKLPVTISFFSPVGIVFTSRRGSSMISAATSFIASFFLMFSISSMHLSTGMTPFWFGMLAVICITTLAILLYRRQGAAEISILDPSRQILGVPGQHHPLSFSDVDHVCLVNKDTTWQIFLMLHSGEMQLLIQGLPLNLSRLISLHVGKLLNVTVLNSKGMQIKSHEELDWKLPISLPSGRFPLEYTFLCSVLAATIVIVENINPGSIFHPAIAPKWMLLLAIAFPAGQLLSAIQEIRGFLAGVSAMIMFMSLVYVCTLISFLEPASTFLGLIPAAVSLILLVNAHVERKKLLAWLLLAIVCTIPGLSTAVFSSYQFHSFRKLDPAVIESIQLNPDQDGSLTILDPHEIRVITSALQNAEIQKTQTRFRSKKLTLNLNRPAGRNFYIELMMGGSGNNSIISYRLACDFWGLRFPLGLLSSSTAHEQLNSLNYINQYWL